MTDKEIQQKIMELYPFLTEEQYIKIMAIIIEIEANFAIDTFVTLLDAFYLDEIGFHPAPTG